MAFQELRRNRSGLDNEGTMRELPTIRRALGSRSQQPLPTHRAVGRSNGDCYPWAPKKQFRVPGWRLLRRAR